MLLFVAARGRVRRASPCRRGATERGSGSIAVAAGRARAAGWVGLALRRPLRRLAALAPYSLAVAQADDTRASGASTRQTRDKALRDRLILTYAPLVKYVAGRLGCGPAGARRRERPRLVRAARADRARSSATTPTATSSSRRTRSRASAARSSTSCARSTGCRARCARARGRSSGRSRELEAQLVRAPTDEEIAEKLGVTDEELEDSLARDLALLDRRARRALVELDGPGDAGRARRHARGSRTRPSRGGELDETEMREPIGEAIARAPRAREARGHALLLRGADAARDRRGARRHRVARLAAPHEGDPAPEGAARGALGALPRSTSTETALAAGPGYDSPVSTTSGARRNVRHA